jgi:hypothetical protein
MKELDYKQSLELLAKLRKRHKQVAVFVDGGWDGHGYEYTIITGGNGQKPHASMTKETFERLRAAGRLDGNSLVTYKARRLHDYVPPRKRGRSTRGDILYRNNPYSIL